MMSVAESTVSSAAAPPIQSMPVTGKIGQERRAPKVGIVESDPSSTDDATLAVSSASAPPVGVMAIAKEIDYGLRIPH